ncbi:sensor domain-containing diguanylate cyclase [Cryptosporangium japonicum]|uniref:Diguanylate cyclase n=1 Tax=Cryptosporangium japonicum TaxID=80872 RepID=A0ABP3EYU3_9ACTN
MVSTADVRARRAQAARTVGVPIVLMSIVLVLRGLDMAGTTPLWVFAILVLSGTVLHSPGLNAAVLGDDPTRWLWPRAMIRFAVNTSISYALGWGAVLAATHFILVSDFLARSGSRAWRPAAVCSVGTIALGQLAVAFGLFSYLPSPPVHGIAALVALFSAISIRMFGNAVRHQESARAALGVSESRFRAVVQDGFDVVTFSDADGAVRYVSPNAERLLGYAPADLLGYGLLNLVHRDDRGVLYELNTRVRARPDAEYSVEVRVRRADGVWRWHEFVVRNSLAHPDIEALVGHQRDVHDRRTAQDRIAYAATHDALTGLVNASAYLLALEESLADGARGGYPVGVLFLDLDGFKAVNDTLGHAAGDEKLRLVSAALRQCCRERDVVGRMGGDEFVVVLNGVAGRAEAERLAATIIARIAADQGDDVPAVGCSIGVAVAEPGAVDARALLRRADAAMYAAKRRGRNGYEVYRSDLLYSAGP